MEMEGLEEKLDAWASGYLEAERLPCLAVAVTKGNEVVLRKEYGSAAQPLPAGLGPAEEASYMMMSCTKVVTAVAALQLLEEGKWALEDPVSKFLPKFAGCPGVISKAASAQDLGPLEPLAGPITMRMLLTHTSGLSYAIIPALTDKRPNPVAGLYAAVAGAATLAEVADAVAGLPLVAQPGSTWNYSMGVDVMGRCVEVMSGEPIDAYFERHIFAPLGMASTAFLQRCSPALAARRVKFFNGNMPALLKMKAAFYAPHDGPKMLEDTNPDLVAGMGTALAPGGGLVSTLSDWLLFTQALLGSGVGASGARVLSAASVDLMASGQIPESDLGPQMNLINGAAADNAHYTQGLGVAVGTGAVKSFEWGGMTSTVFWVDRENDLGVVCLSQLAPSVVYPLRSELKALVYRGTTRAYDHQVLVRDSAARVFARLDFGAMGELDGDAGAVGTRRTIKMGPATIVEEQLTRAVGPLRKAFSYAIVNEDNPFGARGYCADVEVLPDSEGKDLCFVRWNATWDAGLAPAMAALSANIRALIASAGPSARL
jgi:CubicO group peptidase (beta-lactamase class C family)